MTPKEKRYVRKLEIRIEELERHFRFSQDHYLETFHHLFDNRCAMREAYELIFESLTVLQQNMANDPAFMKLRSELAMDRKEVMP